MTKQEILDYIQLRASGIGQAEGYTHIDFYNEIVDMQRKETVELVCANGCDYEPDRIGWFKCKKCGYSYAR